MKSARAVTVSTAVLLIASASLASPYARTFGEAGGIDETTDSAVVDGNAVFCGFTTSTGSGAADGWVSMVDPDGTPIWEIVIGGPFEEFFRGLTVSDTGILVCGSTASAGEGFRDGLLVMLDFDGNILWQRTYGTREEENFSAVALSPDGFYVGGTTTPIETGRGNAWILEVNATGDILWHNEYAAEGVENLRDLTPTNGGLIATIDSNSALGGVPISFFRPWVLTLDGDGNTTSSRTYNVTEGDTFSRIRPLADGGFIAVGEVFSTGFVRGEGWVVRTNLDGSVAWERRIGNHFTFNGFDAFSDFLFGPGDTIVALGSTETGGNGFSSFWLINMTLDGTLLGDRAYGGPGFDQGITIAASANTLLLAGRGQVIPESFESDALVFATAMDGTPAEGCMVLGATDPQSFEPGGLPIVTNLSAPLPPIVDPMIAPAGFLSASFPRIGGMPLCDTMPLCAGDCDGSGRVDFSDLVAMLFAFDGGLAPVECDADGSGRVDFADLVAALFAFGPCDGGGMPLPL